MSLLNDEERAELDQEQREIPDKFQQEQERRGAVLDQLNITNILELSQRDQEVVQ